MTSIPGVSLLAPLPHEAFAPIRLPDWNREQWTRGALELRYPDYRDLSAWIAFRDASHHLADQFLCEDIRDGLRIFFEPEGEPALILENLPVDPELPPIPLDGKRPPAKQAVSEAVITGLLGHYGEILSFFNEKGGSPIHEVTPVPGMEELQSNAGRVRFGFHSDNAFLPHWFRQTGILLYGLCNEDTATTILTAEQIHAAASPELIAALGEPVFRHASPASYAFEGNHILSPPGPILWRDELDLACVTAASSSIEPTTPTAAAALHQFRELIESLTPRRVVVRPGTALLFKDGRVLHGRDPVAGPRWLQRSYFSDSLDGLRWVTGSGPAAFAFDAKALLGTIGGL